MTKAKSALCAGSLALMLALSACSGGGSGTPSSAPASSGASDTSFTNTNAQPRSALQQGGELNMPIGEFTEQKNQFHQDGTTDTWTFWDWYNAEMIKFKPNGDLNINPAYLLSVTPQDVDGKTVVTYVMNPQAKFNDGTPMDIKAFQNTWKANNGSDPAYLPSSTDGWNKIASVEQGKDAFEIVVTFIGPWPWWGGVFNTLLHPACNTADCFNTGYLGNDMASAHPEWGVGPYKLQSFDGLAGNAVFVPNENWWGDKGLLDKVTIVQRDAQAEMNALNNGEIDSMEPFSAADTLNQVKNAPGTETRTGAATSNFMLQINSQSAKSPALQDIKVRQAIMMSVDRQKVQSVRFGAMGYTEPFPGSFLLFGFQTGYVDNFSKVVPNVDIAGAKALLEGDGYVMGADGFYAKDGAQLSTGITVFGDATSTIALAQSVQAMLKDAGINVTIDQRASADFSDVMSRGDWDMNISGFASGDPFGVAYTCQIYCSQADPNYSGLNKSGTGNADLDAKIHAMEQLPTAEEQIDAANALEVDAFATYGLMPLFNGPSMTQTKVNLANVGSAVFAGKAGAMGDFRENIGWMA